MEKAGTGIQRVKDDCRNNGNKVSFDFTDSFWVTIDSNMNEIVPENVPEIVLENVPEKRLELIIEMINHNNKITIRKFAENLNVDPKTIKRDLDKLKKDKRKKTKKQRLKVKERKTNVKCIISQLADKLKNE